MTSTKEEVSSPDPEEAAQPSTASDIKVHIPSNDTCRDDDAALDIGEDLSSNSRWLKLSNRIESFLGLESRGIHRVESHEQTAETTLSFIEILVMWLSINTTAQNITLASIGQSVYQLGFWDATFVSILGAFLGSIPVAYTASWGGNGNRTMICARFSMGWWPVKLCVLLNLVVMLGYAMIDAVIAGQILSAVSPNGPLSVAVGIIITAILTWLVTTFGIKIFHHYERFAWLLQCAALLILVGTAGPKFDIHSQSIGGSSTIIGHRLSFFSVCLSSAITYAPCASDYMVYCSPALTSPRKVFWAVLLSLTISFALTFVLGVGLASGIPHDPLWALASAGSGALIVAGFSGLGMIGKFCSALTALGLISNMVPEIYSSGINFQILGRYPAHIPRFVWNTIGLFIVAVAALAGRNNLALIFTNFLAFMGSWIGIWIVITLEDQFVFRRRRSPAYDWADWDKQEKLPLGLAALSAFCAGWAGAVLCMAQVYFVGPAARLVGRDGGDMGTFVGFCVAGVVYPPLRLWELKRFGR